MVSGANEKADEWAMLAAGEPDARGVECLGYSDWVGARAVPLPGSRARRGGISGEKWSEAGQWAGGASRKKCKMLSR